MCCAACWIEAPKVPSRTEIEAYCYDIAQRAIERTKAQMTMDIYGVREIYVPVHEPTYWEKLVEWFRNLGKKAMGLFE
ncbi:MAG TPA: hypothetical protein V6C86_24235 [Oculatellaceae cyanobacterium]